MFNLRSVFFFHYLKKKNKIAFWYWYWILNKVSGFKENRILLLERGLLLRRKLANFGPFPWNHNFLSGGNVRSIIVYTPEKTVGRREETASRDWPFDPADSHRIQDSRIRITGHQGCIFLRQMKYDSEFCEECRALFQWSLASVLFFSSFLLRINATVSSWSLCHQIHLASVYPAVCC